MLNCSWEHSSERQKQCQCWMGSIWGMRWLTFSNEMALTPCGWGPHVPMECFSRSFCVLQVSCVSCLARDKLPFFSTYFLFTCFFPVVLVPFLPSRGSLASPNLPSVHALPCQVALDVPCGAGFTYFGVFHVFPLFLDVRRRWFCTLNYQLWFFFLKSF